MRRTLLALWLLGACSVGEVKTGGGAPDAGAIDPQDVMTFNQMIAPMVTRCTGCHGVGQPPNLLSFEALQSKYKEKPGGTNILVTKGDATAGQHSGMPYLNADEKIVVTNWINGL